MKAVILCGGKGLRMTGAARLSCKPLIEIGGMPILWHIMKIFKVYGINKFVLCLGHYGNNIKEYFLNLNWQNNSFHLTKGEVHFYSRPEEWDIVFADTGLETMTGGRILQIEKFIEEDEFMLTYGDGVADIPLDRLLAFHRQKGKFATVTGVRHRSSYGVIEVENGSAASFREKPLLDGWINGGFYVLNKKVFDYINGDSCVWENEPLSKLVRDNQLAVYQHRGFWQPMDTAKDAELLNGLWHSNNMPWVKW